MSQTIVVNGKEISFERDKPKVKGIEILIAGKIAGVVPVQVAWSACILQGFGTRRYYGRRDSVDIQKENMRFLMLPAGTAVAQ